MYQAEYHPHEVSNTEKQQAVKSVFKDKAKVASAWWNKNKPTQQNPTGTEAYRAVKKAYGAQIKIGNPYSFLLYSGRSTPPPLPEPRNEGRKQ